MAIEGFPDVNHHRYCCRCKKWFEPEDGSAVSDGRWRPLDWVRRRISIPEIRQEFFLCYRCQRARKLMKSIFVILLALAITFTAGYLFHDTYVKMTRTWGR